MTESPTAERKTEKPHFAAPHVFVLVPANGEDPARVHRIGQRETVLGRGEESDFIIPDEEISNRHCVIHVDGSVCEVRDLESRNGTMVNGRTVREGVSQRLRHLDELEIGGTRLILLTGRFSEQPRRV